MTELRELIECIKNERSFPEFFNLKYKILKYLEEIKEEEIIEDDY